MEIQAIPVQVPIFYLIKEFLRHNTGTGIRTRAEFPMFEFRHDGFRVIASVVDPKLLITNPDPGPTFKLFSFPDPTFKTFLIWLWIRYRKIILKDLKWHFKTHFSNNTYPVNLVRTGILKWLKL
jgi:hypothetical protein